MALAPPGASRGTAGIPPYVPAGAQAAMHQIRHARRTRRTPTPVGAAFVLLLAIAAGASAQVVNDPRIVEFVPSPDHFQTLGSGQAAVTRYEFGVFLAGAAAPFTTIDLGKPAPGDNGRIRYDFASGVAGWPLPGGTYEARVSAVGPDGAAWSDPSNPFTFGAAPCTFSLSADALTIPAAGGSYGVNVNAAPGCAWTASTTLPWVALWATEGTGPGTVPFGIEANSATTARSGAVSIAGQVLMLAQAAAPPPPPKTTPTVSWPAPASITQGMPLGPEQLNASASVPGTFHYSPAAGTVLPAGSHLLTAAFAPADTLLYNGASASATITVVVPSYTLSLARPTGGTVTGSGVSCGSAGSACSVTAPAASAISLLATADRGYAFGAWTGDCAGTTPAQTVVLDRSKSCGATFTSVPTVPLGPPYTLTIVRPAGGVVKAGIGINCGTRPKSCSATAPAAMTVILQATPDKGYVFTGWTGHCTGEQPNHALALEGARSCGATFTPVR